jgi:hypothetical protein
LDTTFSGGAIPIIPIYCVKTKSKRLSRLSRQPEVLFKDFFYFVGGSRIEFGWLMATTRTVASSLLLLFILLIIAEGLQVLY